VVKHLPNLISCLRIILLFVLFFVWNKPFLFLLLYGICGLSDVLDGFIARKLNLESEFGARLDSFADFLFFITLTVCIIQWMENEIRLFIPWVILIVLVRIINLGISYYKYHTLATLHTWGNKFAGFLLFICPFFLLYDRAFILYVAVAAAILSASEEMLIHLTTSTLDLNRQSIFIKTPSDRSI